MVRLSACTVSPVVGLVPSFQLAAVLQLPFAAGYLTAMA
jgi:hypothetical protein